jgi:hypothetical protein
LQKKSHIWIRYVAHLLFLKRFCTEIVLNFMAITVMVLNILWGPDFFGAQDVLDLKNLSPKNLVVEKYGAQDIWAPHESHHIAFSWGVIISLGPNFSGSKFNQISQGPNFVGIKKVRSPNEIGDHFNYSQCYALSVGFLTFLLKMTISPMSLLKSSLTTVLRE